MSTNPPDPSPEGSMPLFDRAEQVFFEVAALAPIDRSAAISRLCKGDVPLEQEVLALVASAERMGAFLDKPVLGREFDDLSAASRAHESPDDLVGATLGPFTVEARLASGGMGTVYVARRSDEQFRQRVAIKVVKRGLDSEEILQRFTEERHALASLDHPNIARLLDAGVTPDGRPYLVMEYVDGEPIDEYCDRRRLSVRHRLELFRGVCEAVHAAHRCLIVHRDLKPGNILVTSAGIPKLLDFGIAKVLDPGLRTRETVVTERRLTPEYASPEQVQGQSITTASDVYSLGVVLYELLTGVRPYGFVQRSNDEVRKVVCHLLPQAPSRAVTVRVERLRQTTAPSTIEPASSQPMTSGSGPDHPKTHGVTSTRLRGLLRGDIDNIVLMALRKEPRRRYASAEQMAADIGRFLAGMPVQARGDTWSYRSRKFIRRHRLAVTASIAFVLFLVAGLAHTLRQNAEITRQRDQLAATNSGLQQTREFLVSVLGGAQTSGLGPGATLRDVLSEADQLLSSSPPDDPDTLAAAQQAIGVSMMTLGIVQQARPLLDAAVVRFQTLPADSEIRLSAEFEQAQLLYYEGKHAESEAALRPILARERARAAGAHTTREADILNAIGTTLRTQSKTDEALAVHAEVLLIRTRLFGPQSLKVAETHNNIAAAKFSKGDFAGAAEGFSQSLATRILLLRPDHPLVVATRSNLGLATLRNGDAAAALPFLEQAAATWTAAYGPTHPGRATALISLAQAHRKLGAFDQALASLRLADEWHAANSPVNSPARHAVGANIGITLALKGDCDQAVTIIESHLATLENAKGMAGITDQSFESLINCYESLGNATAAEQAKTRRKAYADRKR